MKKKLDLLAFDLGASNGRAILGSFDGEKLGMTELHRFENNYVEMNGVFYWDTPYLYAQMKQGFAACARGGIRPDSFGVDTWGVDYGLLDRNGNLTGLPRSYRYGVQADVDAVTARIPAAELYSRTGIDPTLTFNTLYQLYRRRRENDPALDSAETLLLTPDLLGYFFTGEKGSEYTMTTTTQLYDPLRKDWDRRTIRELGLPERIFTPVDRTGTIRGRLTGRLSEELGCGSPAFVAVGSHDTASSVAAIPGTGSFAFCSSGTWSLFGVETDQPDLSAEAMQAGFSNEGTVGGGFSPLRNIIGLWIIQECRRDWQNAGKKLSWDDITAAAAQAAPFRSVIDTDSPEFYAGGNMERKIRAYCERNGQPAPETVGETARCIYESLALKYRLALEGLEAVKKTRIDSLNLTGGGIQNGLLNQMAADALDRPVITGPIEGAAAGNLLVQAMALGEIGSLAELREVVRNSAPIGVCEPVHTAAWEDAYGKLKACIEREKSK